MKKLLVFIVTAALLVTPALASAEPILPDGAAPDTMHHVTVEVTKEATCGEKGLLTYSYDGEPYLTVETLPTGEHTPDGPAATCTEPVACAVCGTILEPAAGHAYTYQYDAEQNEDGTFASFGTWKCDTCGDVMEATEGNAVYYYGLAEAPDPAAGGSAAEGTASDATPADAAEEATPADAGSEPAQQSEGRSLNTVWIVLAVVIVVVLAALMRSFGKKRPVRKEDGEE